MKIRKFNEDNISNSVKDLILDYLIDRCEVGVGHPTKSGKGESNLVYCNVQLKEGELTERDLIGHIFSELNIEFITENIIKYKDAEREFTTKLITDLNG